jgi:hypothetical protein
MRRCPLRGQENIWKRQLIHVGAFNRSLILRQRLGAGTRREWKNRCGRLVLTLYLLFPCRMNQKRFCRSRISSTLAQCFIRRKRLKLVLPLVCDLAVVHVILPFIAMCSPG